MSTSLFAMMPLFPVDEEKAEINEQIDKVFKPIGDLYKRHAPQILAAPTESKDALRPPIERRSGLRTKLPLQP